MSSVRDVNDSDLVIKDLVEEMLRSGKCVRFQVRGWSMHPFIRDRDFVTVKPIGVEDIKIGDVIAYQNLQNKKIIIHRLIKKKPHLETLSLLFAGDSLLSHDSPIDPSDYLLGKVTAVEKDGKMINLESKLSYAHGYFKALILLFCPWGLVLWRKCIHLFSALFRKAARRCATILLLLPILRS